MNKPLVYQNVRGLTLVLCIIFITDFFTWLHVKSFHSTELGNSVSDSRLSKEVLELLSVMF